MKVIKHHKEKIIANKINMTEDKNLYWFKNMCPYELVEIIKFQAKLIMINTYNYVKIRGWRKIQISKQRINLIIIIKKIRNI